MSIDGLVARDSRLDLIRECKAGVEPLCQFISSLDKGVDAHALDELHGPARPGRKTNAEDGADIGVMHSGEHVFA